MGVGGQCPGCFTLGKHPVPIVQETRWAPGPVWTRAENLAPTGIQSLDCPACSKSLYQLRYPGPCWKGSTLNLYLGGTMFKYWPTDIFSLGTQGKRTTGITVPCSCIQSCSNTPESLILSLQGILTPGSLDDNLPRRTVTNFVVRSKLYLVVFVSN